MSNYRVLHEQTLEIGHRTAWLSPKVHESRQWSSWTASYLPQLNKHAVGSLWEGLLVMPPLTHGETLDRLPNVHTLRMSDCLTNYPGRMNRFSRSAVCKDHKKAGTVDQL